jgi:two-component system, NarL family, response regulator LiaR
MIQMDTQHLPSDRQIATASGTLSHNVPAVEPVNTSVILVGGHAITRRGLSAILNSAPGFRVILETKDSDRVLKEIQFDEMQLILLDLSPFGQSSARVVNEVERLSLIAKIVVFVPEDYSELAFLAIQAGAHSVLPPSILEIEFIESLRRILMGEVVIHPIISSWIARSVRLKAQSEISPIENLSAREALVLRVLAEGRSNAKIAEALYLSEATIKSHVASILAKLRLASRTEAVAYAWRAGLMRNPIDWRSVGAKPFIVGQRLLSEST